MKSAVAAIAAVTLLLSGPVFAQVYNRPSEPPIVTAANDSWYRLGAPVFFAGGFYYPAGPLVFFDGDVMVRTGHYNGVPLYADTTLEPHSVVFVPIGRNLMQPYERRRTGELAGTTGSRAPSFPGSSERMPRDVLQAPGPPTLIPPPTDIGTAAIPETTCAATCPDAPLAEPVPVPPRLAKPFSYSSISVQFMGEKWVMEGPSRPMGSDLQQVAEYKGFPVYATTGNEPPRIYLPITPDRIAPFIPQR